MRKNLLIAARSWDIKKRVQTRFLCAAQHPDTLTLFRDPLNISKTTLEERRRGEGGGGRRLKERHASELTQIFIIARTN